MNLKIVLIALAAGTCLVACEGKSTSEPDKKPETAPAEHSPTKIGGGPKLEYFSPLIFDGHISVITPDADASTKQFYSLHWGDSEKHPFFTEQTLLCKTSMTLSGLEMKEFPNTLPMAIDDSSKLKVYWQFGRKPDGTPSDDNVKFNEFYDYAKSLSNGNDDKFMYAVTIAFPHKGAPPAPDPNDLDATANGVFETFSIPEIDCSGSVFALPFTDPSDFERGAVKGAYKKRRILEAISTKCAGLEPAKLKGKIATISEVQVTTYQKWYDSVSGWPDMQYADGAFVYARALPASKAEAEALRDTALKMVSK